MRKKNELTLRNINIKKWLSIKLNKYTTLKKIKKKVVKIIKKNQQGAKPSSRLYFYVNIHRFFYKSTVIFKGVSCYRIKNKNNMILNILILIKKKYTPTLAFRRSCREAICGSCAMNIDGVNALACISEINTQKEHPTLIKINPLPHVIITRDLITDFFQFFQHIFLIKPWLISNTVTKVNNKKNFSFFNTKVIKYTTYVVFKSNIRSFKDFNVKNSMILRPKKKSLNISKKKLRMIKVLKKTNLQKIADRANLDGLYECILCACCSTSCPSYWWNSETFIGPAALLALVRWIKDTRDIHLSGRSIYVAKELNIYRCHTIMNCTKVCPKGLKPSKELAELKKLIFKIKNNRLNYEKKR